VELFAGTVAENIARFEPGANPTAVIAAARAAEIHDLILRLPEGYDTRIWDGGVGLSAGQRQSVGLAQALYGNSFLVILDEPDANLDAEGENALTQAILKIRRRGDIAVVIAHRPSALAALDLVLMMTDGRAQAFGPKDEFLKRVLWPTAVLGEAKLWDRAFRRSAESVSDRPAVQGSCPSSRIESLSASEITWPAIDIASRENGPSGHSLHGLVMLLI